MQKALLDYTYSAVLFGDLGKCPGAVVVGEHSLWVTYRASYASGPLMSACEMPPLNTVVHIALCEEEIVFIAFSFGVRYRASFYTISV